MYLLNSDVLFELFKNKPCENVTNWCESIPEGQFSVSVLTIGILKSMIEEKSTIQQKSIFRCWMRSKFVEWFDGNIISIDAKISQRWGDYIDYPHTVNVIDGLLASTAIENDLIFVTSHDCNIKGLKIFNPFV